MSTETIIPLHADVAEPKARYAFELDGVGRRYTTDAGPVDALRNVTCTIPHGEAVVIQGPSGSGKSTLLQLLGMLDTPTSGTIMCDGGDVSKLSPSAQAELRLRKIGFVFQQFNLIPTLTARQNVEIAMFPVHAAKRTTRARADELLEQVGLGRRAGHKPNQLSGGEQQRVAIARALANEPELLLADEPTGNLDSETSGEILDVIRGLWLNGLTVVLITHDPSIAERIATRSYSMRDGQLVDVR